MPIKSEFLYFSLNSPHVSTSILRLLVINVGLFLFRLKSFQICLHNAPVFFVACALTFALSKNRPHTRPLFAQIHSPFPLLSPRTNKSQRSKISFNLKFTENGYKDAYMPLRIQQIPLDGHQNLGQLRHVGNAMGPGARPSFGPLGRQAGSRKDRAHRYPFGIILGPLLTKNPPCRRNLHLCLLSYGCN